MIKYIALFLIVLITSCQSTKKEKLENHLYTNALVNETSPYLLQHAHNPVNWMPWNETTLEKAKTENKLMIVSIGYAACHWCHVMERESFEDSTVAAVMNKNFVSVKVDREERPDVDQIYINAVQLMTGSAGWPLNVITLPDGRPVWGGTYFPKEDWIQAIDQIQTLYADDPDKLLAYASRLEEGIKSMDLITLNTDQMDFEAYDTKSIIDTWSYRFDTIHGGFRGAPKFMTPSNWNFLLRHATATQNESLLQQVELSLEKIAFGGVYDHIGGGFARYSVDERWHVPHFEKMLYDNAQLASLYSQAYAVTGNPLYKEVVEETLTFVEREMTNEEGAFYSSLDADSETESGELEEGAFYIYSEAELRTQLAEDFSLFADYYNVNDFGKWEEEGAYVLIRNQNDESFIAEHPSLDMESLSQKKKEWKAKLLDYRNRRIRPRLDDKTLTSWNGLMIKGYVDAYKVFQNPSYLEKALKNGAFLIEHQLQESGALFHSYKDGKSTINGYLEDYAAVSDAFLALYEVTLDDRWLHTSKQLVDYAFEKFFDAESGMFYFTSSDDPEIVTRNFEYRDNVIPASNSIMAKNLFVLSHHFDEKKYAETSQQMLKNIAHEMEKYPSGFSNWLDLLAHYQSKYYEIVVVGTEAQSKLKELNKNYLPNTLIAGSDTAGELPLLKGRFLDNKTLIYVCVNNTCKLPVTETEAALKLLK
ncbi:thioredoxin domain-containing protein [Aureisphaera galaxeae]|uniref:thioredoxin domain-containing protein n=1 Tax=Aureisphaera galaxeae TaxID=1538023 RepID=UPI00234FBDBE|nr:thioredoxin domain-containing protein [Aureisphaera galaxeae]MDC8005780.1 thioredoxin domain-containing protein [Aureisphaera galaxeae]